MQTPATFTSFVAIGDSFTEGMSDVLPDGSYRGWADLLAARLAARHPDFRYANLAVRGKLIRQIAEDQVDTAAAMRADLVTLVGGLNDVLRPKCDVDAVCAQLESAVERLAPSCGRLVLMRSPARRGPVATRFAPRMEQLFTFIDDLGRRHGALVVDLYGAEVLGDPRLWADDRLHLTAGGHERVAEAIWQRLGLPAESEWTLPLPPAVPLGWAARRTADVRFTREHLLPWIGRRLTGRSSGDGRPAKRPELLPYSITAPASGTGATAAGTTAEA
ncbi:SGNH/GDSL hydrolase family protein [Actinacidiphila acidipaludis]|uniref:SGNH/GDSL hydrolase family protein n=1 Tax=Actinacidiphila acidipaludis TaxID=2873382 RepID=A0ABS7Q5R9_9ACTN|nr:SGNH/GDSL hydrolase family protein [Streptomyces acidipaludis]MBY8878313.1 SGNH/GDSL hydrolase family protein [Streptomyces acidipaludis]